MNLHIAIEREKYGEYENILSVKFLSNPDLGKEITYVQQNIVIESSNEVLSVSAFRNITDNKLALEITQNNELLAQLTSDGSFDLVCTTNSNIRVRFYINA
ncbi:MAG: hypothetical protein K6L81_18155 [Agarilytica sp.]